MKKEFEMKTTTAAAAAALHNTTHIFNYILTWKEHNV